MSDELSTLTKQNGVAWVERIFEIMLYTFGAERVARFWSATDPDKVKAFWANSLEGYTGAEIARGLEEMQKRVFIPSLPEFKALCRPPIDYTEALREAMEGFRQRARGVNFRYSHPAIYWASASNQYELQSRSHEQVATLWRRALDRELAKGKWEPVPDVQVAPVSRQLEGATTKKLDVNNLKTIFTLKKDNPDPFAWAKKIMSDFDANPDSVSLLQKQKAERALNSFNNLKGA